jgi:3-hydroxyacyl-[acyl-carrier-protein] dehydratase
MDAAPSPDVTAEIDIIRVMEMIPHRFPMIMVDRVVDVMPNVSAVGIKNVSANEHFFQGHFPARPVMPGVLIVESMAQTAAVLVVQTLGDDAAGKLVYFMSIDSCRFRRPVTPGDQMRIKVEKIHHRRNVWKFFAEAQVEGQTCAQAEFAAMILDD